MPAKPPLPPSAPAAPVTQVRQAPPPPIVPPSPSSSNLPAGVALGIAELGNGVWPPLARAETPAATLSAGDVLAAVPLEGLGVVPDAEARPPGPPGLYFREVLLRSACTRTGCQHAGERLDIRPECHGWAGLRALYAFDRGVLLVACGECGAEVAELPVASMTAARLPNVHLIPLATAFPPPLPPEPPPPPPAEPPPEPPPAHEGWWARHRRRR